MPVTFTKSRSYPRRRESSSKNNERSKAAHILRWIPIYMGMSGLLFLSACSPAAPSFDAALDKHFEAIQNRDLAAYTETITKGENLPLIFPDGTAMLTRAEVIAFHEGWFTNKDWRMTFEPVSKIVGKDMATVILSTSYRDTPDGEPRFGYLALTFQLQDGEWRLVQDQNTRIVQSKE